MKALIAPGSLRKVAGEEEMSSVGQFSGPSLNPAGALMMGVARKTDQWKPADKGPPRVPEKTAMKLADWQPREIHRDEPEYGKLSPLAETGRMTGSLRRAGSNPKMLAAQLIASNLLGGNPKLAAVTVAAFGDELRRIQGG